MSPENKRFLKNWWLLFIKGIIISVYGVIFLLNRMIDLDFRSSTLIKSFIIISVFNGLLILYGSFFYRKNNQHWFYWLLEGTFDFILGLAGFIYIMLMEMMSYLVVNLFFIQILGLWALIHGIIHTLSANRAKNYVASAKIAMISGVGVIVLSLTIIALAILIFLKPLIFKLPDFYFIGSFCIIIGLLLSFISVILRNIYSD